MKTNLNKDLISKLNRIREELQVLASPESRGVLLKDLDDLIAALNRLRVGLTNPPFEAKAAEIHRPLEQVIAFLEFAKSDEVLKTLLLPARRTVTAKPKRKAVEVPSNLTNDQIRALLERDLSKTELKAIAAQRSISIGKSNNEKIKQDILRNLERQEGYGRLATS